MENNELPPCYTSTLPLRHNDKLLNASLCFSKCPLDILMKRTSAFLHPKEQAYFNTLHYPKRQHSYLLGRYCAKQATCDYMQSGCLSSSWIENGVFHQPIVYSSSPSDVQVSISHTSSLGAAIAFPEQHPMGIDVEIIDREHIGAIRSELTGAERQKAIFFAGDESLYLTLVWTIKEALSKALKCGFTIPLEILEVGEIRPRERERGWESSFKQFQQFEARSFVLDQAICSLVFPKGTDLHIDIAAIAPIVNGDRI